MNMRIVAAPNAFKGSMNAVQAAQAMKTGILAVIPQCEVTCVPVADGGDGLIEVMLAGLSGTRVEAMVSGPRMEPLSAPFCMVPLSEAGRGGNGQSQRAGPVAQGIA